MRTCPIARVSIRAPQYQGLDIVYTANWLRNRADDVERADLSDNGFTAIRRTFGEIGRPGMFRTIAKLHVGAAGSLSPQTRKRIAKWLRSRADHLTNGRGIFKGAWFTQVFSL